MFGRVVLLLVMLLAAAGATAADWRERYGEFYRLVASQAIVLQEGSAGEVIVVADPDCPYCADFEARREAGELDGYTVRLILVDFLAPEQGAAAGILCASDPAAAWRRYLREGSRPAACASPAHAIHRRIAEIAEIWATPAFMTPGAQTFTGLLPAARLRAAIAEGQL